MDVIVPTLSNYLYTVPTFLTYVVILMVAMVAFSRIYTWITPHDEFALIRNGNEAAAISFAGAFIGYALAITSVLVHATARPDFVIWAVFALVLQLFAYFVACRFVLRGAGEKIAEGNRAAGLFVGSVSLGVGVLNAGLMVY